MIRIHIGNDVRNADDVDQQWLCNQIDGRRRHHEPACVRVTIQGPDVDLHLQMPGCPAYFGVPRPLTGRESRIVELWRELNLEQDSFSCRDLQRFLVEVRRFI